MNSRSLSYVLAAGALVALTIVAFAVGRYPVSLSEITSLVLGQPVGANVETVVLQVRGPRVLAALIVGAALAAAGTAYQGMFRNPLVSPDILGVSTGAAWGRCSAIFLSLEVLFVQLFAFAGGLVAVGMVYFIGSRLRGHDPLLALVLTGVVIGTLLGSAIALIKYLADPYNQLPAITYWLLGSLAAISPRDLAVAAPLALLGLAPMLLLRWRMNLLALPDDEARALGVDTRKLRTARRRRGHPDDGRGGRGERHHRLGRTADPARRAPAGRPGLRAAAAAGDAARRRVPARRGHAVPHHRHHRGAAGRADGADRHAVLPLAVRRRRRSW